MGFKADIVVWQANDCDDETTTCNGSSTYSEYARFTLHKVSVSTITFFMSTHVGEIIFEFYSYSLFLNYDKCYFLLIFVSQELLMLFLKLKFVLLYFYDICILGTRGSAGFLTFGATLGITRRRGRRKRRDLVAAQAWAYLWLSCTAAERRLHRVPCLRC